MIKAWSERDGEAQTTHIRVLLTSWGLAADLTAHLKVVEIRDGLPGHLIPVGKQLALDVSGAALAYADVDALTVGLQLMAPQMPVAAGPQAIVVFIERLSMTLTDYQPEAATIAMAHWLADRLQLDHLNFDVRFDNATNRYVLTY